VPILYRARDCTWKPALSKMDADRHTDASFWLHGSRHPKVMSGGGTGGTFVGESFEDAKQWLIAELEDQRDLLEDKAEAIEIRLSEIRRLEEHEAIEDNDQY
jgi:hypothetical protein